MNRRCLKHGHKWRQAVWGVLGTDVCARRGCGAQRVNPRALPGADLTKEETDAQGTT